MRRLATIPVLLAALLLPSAAGAQLVLGARAGYAFGIGNVGGALAMSDWVNGQVPLQVDGLYRVNPRLAIGAYFSYGFGFAAGEAADVCDAPGGDCTATVRRLGVQATYTFPPRGRLVPWAGAFVGYEWLTLENENPATPEKVTFKGWEYLGAQGGADFPLSGKLAVGPFVAVSIAQYGEGEPSGSAESEPVPDKKLHQWLTLGVRGRFDL